jgi:hypothetical protein
MPFPAYRIGCYGKGCDREAIFKIASRWSDGLTEELKTYSLCCAECLRDQYRLSLGKQSRCRLAAEEILDAPAIYQLKRGARDRELDRLRSREAEILAEIEASPSES